MSRSEPLVALERAAQRRRARRILIAQLVDDVVERQRHTGLEQQRQQVGGALQLIGHPWERREFEAASEYPERMSVLDQLPTVNEKRMAVRVTPDARRQIAAGHPWIFNESISSISHRGAVGDLAVIFDNDRNFVAIGLWDPGSPIRIRILHHGKPATIDATFWQQTIAAAVERRHAIGSGHRRLSGAQWRERRLPRPCARPLRRHVGVEAVLARCGSLTYGRSYR